MTDNSNRGSRLRLLRDVVVLRGTPDAPIRPGRSSAFGALADWRKAEVERLLDALVDQGYLRRDDEDEYRRLWLTDTGQAATATGVIDIEWRVTPAARATPAEEETDADPELLATLKAWRRALQAPSLP